MKSEPSSVGFTSNQPNSKYLKNMFFLKNFQRDEILNCEKTSHLKIIQTIKQAVKYAKVFMIVILNVY